MVSLVCDNCSTPLPLGSRYCNACGTPVPGEGVEGGSPNGARDLREALRLATADEYEIHHELGRGGMGSVFLAREIGLDRLVAIKVLPPTLMFDSGLVERFKREARMVAKLHHPNIIPVYRVHAANSLVFYTMHYVPGRTLGDIMTPGRLMSMPEAEKRSPKRLQAARTSPRPAQSSGPRSTSRPSNARAARSTGGQTSIRSRWWATSSWRDTRPSSPTR
jgi:hypothetical protein